MNTHLLALQLMAAQGLLGAFDTLYHHELTEALPSRPSARKELWIHATRASFYSLLFIGLSAWQWHGIWALVLMFIFTVEIVLTLWDFIIEDRTRLLPATERVTHTVLAINGGAFITLLALTFPAWFSQSTELQWAPQGWLSVFLFACGIGVGLSGIRDGFAAYALGKVKNREELKMPLHFSDKSESVLVTGATGFIGQLLVNALIADGQRVTVLTRNAKKAAWTFDGKVTCVESMNELPANYPIDTIINLAGARVLGWWWTSSRQVALRKSRIGLTQSLIDWIAKAEVKPALLLNASAIGYYGIQAIGDNTELTEDSPTQNIFMAKLCHDWEVVAQSARQYGVQVSAMRFGMVLGHQGPLPMLLLPIKLGLGGKLGSGKQWMSWIHVDDLLRALAHIWQLAENPETKEQLKPEYNFTAPETLTQLDFSKVAAKVLHRPCFFPTPAWPMRLGLGEQADLLLEGQRVVPKNLLASGFEFTYPDAQSALRSLV
ncbi:epimerase [Cellvibrio zantedeschiae]|uniref:Epimerase n=1 Tax=Cellvibrio zantedeschiae TaxID=1237077 RepID=A0ABQ3B694_9GAMM|nr:TIGR01777 family oxidoreductase [Cellvibrio zantedeschiae]GGY80504.1 epimerase [Cellvibrio zantedeschiae]